VSGFGRWADTKGGEAADFFLALGPDTVPGLIDLYAEDEALGGSEVLFKLLVNFGQPAVSEALERLDDASSDVIRNLLLLVRHAGTHEAIPQIRPLVKHEDMEVRMEALAILLKFKDPTGIILLREALLSHNRNESSQAVYLAGRYGGDDVAEDLVSMLDRRPFLKSGYTSNEMIIKALGEIGNPQAIPHLERLARSRWILYPGSLSHMKAVLFESLEQYPKEGLEGLLRIGSKSDDPRIKRACKRVM
jgi:HEAT repeat protein